MKVSKKMICDAASASLIEFGYPDASPEMIGEIYDAYKEGKRFPDLPYSVIGAFAEKQFDDLSERGVKLP